MRFRVNASAALAALVRAWCTAAVLTVGSALAAPSFAAKPAAGTLGPIRSLTFPAWLNAGEPCLTADSAGAVYASWFERRHEGGHVLKVSKLDGSRWSTPNAAAAGDSFFVNWADTPILLAMGDGRLALSWPWKSGAGPYSYDVRIAQSFNGGRTWSAPVTPHRDRTATEHGFVSLVPEGDHVRAVWLDGRKSAIAEAGHESDHGHGAEMTLRTATIDRDGALGNEAELDGRVCDCCPTAMVATSSVDVIVAYRDREADEIRDVSLMRGRLGSNNAEGETRSFLKWSEASPIGNERWKMAACPVNGPAMDAAGERVVAAWYTGANDDPAVYVARSSDGGVRFDPPVRIDTPGGKGTLGRVDAVIRPDGAALVSWIQAESGGARILVREIGADGTMGDPVTVAFTSAKRASGFPRMVRSGDRVIFAWTEAGDPARIRAATAKWAPSR